MNKVVKIIGVIAIVIIVPKTIMKVMGPKQPTPNSEIAFFVKKSRGQVLQSSKKEKPGSSLAIQQIH